MTWDFPEWEANARKDAESIEPVPWELKDD
jgi:hypothetical protein